MRRPLLITATMLVLALPLRPLAQAPLQPSHQPSFPLSAPGPPAAVVLARVNGVAITQAELEEETQRLFPYYAIHGGRVPAGAEAELRQQAMHDAVLHELVYQEARRRKLQVPSATWQKRLQQIRKGFRSPQAYEAAATQKYGSVAEYERRLRRAMLVQQLWDAEVTRKAAVTTQAVRAYYQGHKVQYVRPEAVRLQTITINVPSTASAEQKQQARKIVEQILVKAKAAQNYQEFGVLAEQLSQDDWRVMLGDHRWVHRGTVTPELEPAVFSLKAGETSGIVETSNGYVILRANEHQPQRQMSFPEMAASLRQRLQKEQVEKRARDFEQWLRSQARIEGL